MKSRIKMAAFVVILAVSNSYAIDLECVHVEDKYNCDTAPDCWSGLPSYELTPAEGLKPQNADDISANFSLAWNRQYFFVIVRVLDNNFCPGDSMSGFWNYDSVQFAFSSPGKKHFFSYGACDLPFGPKVILVENSAGIESEAVDCPFKAVHNDNHITYIVALPWRFASCLDPLSGKVFSFNLIVNENDGAKRLGWLELTQGIGKGLDLNKFRRMRFTHVPVGPQIHISSQTDIVNIPCQARLHISAVGLENASSLKIQAGRNAKLLPLGDKTSISLTELMHLDADSPEHIKIKASLLDKSGASLASASTILRAHYTERLQAELSQAIADLTKIERGIADIRKGGRAVDYFAIRAACIKHAIRVAKTAIASGRSISALSLYKDSVVFAKQAAKNLLADVKSFANNSNLHQPVIPQPNLQVPWSVKNGNIYAGDTPVTLVGFVWLYGHKDLTYRLYDIGMNMQTVDAGPSAVIGNDGKLKPDIRNTDAISFYRRACLWGQKNGEVFELHTSPHYLPDYLPENFKVDNHNACFGTETGKALLRLTYKGLAEAFGDLSCIRAADLANEWTYWSATPEDMAEFHKWLKNRYGTIQKLNIVWQTTFSNFDEIPSPFVSVKNVQVAPKGVYQPLNPEGIYRNRGPYWDWCSFNTDQAAKIVRWMQDEFKKSNPQLLTQIKCVLSSLEYRTLANNFMMGIDPEKILPVTDFIGTDASYIRGLSWQGTLMVYDYLKSICPDKPIACTESHAVPYNDASAPGEIRRGIFQRFVHGERLGLMFLNVTFANPQWWVSKMEGHEMNTWNISASPETVESLALTSADIRRLAGEFSCFNARSAEVLIYYDNAADFGIPGSVQPQGQYGNRALEVYRKLIPLDVKCGFITGKMLAEKPLPTAKVIILASAEYMPNATVEALCKYVEQGNKLVLIGENFKYDQYGRKRKKIPQILQTAKAGYRLDFKYLNILQRIIGKAGVRPPYSIKGCSWPEKINMEILSAKMENGQNIVFIANANSNSVCFTVKTNNSSETTGWDLVSNRQVSTKQMNLAANGVMLIIMGRTNEGI